MVSDLWFMGCEVVNPPPWSTFCIEISLCAAFISFSSPAPRSRSQGCAHFSPGARPAHSMFTLNRSCCWANTAVADGCCRGSAPGYPWKSTLHLPQQISAPVLPSQHASGLPHPPSLYQVLCIQEDNSSQPESCQTQAGRPRKAVTRHNVSPDDSRAEVGGHVCVAE